MQVHGPMVHLTQKETSADLPVHWADHSLLLCLFRPFGTFAHPDGLKFPAQSRRSLRCRWTTANKTQLCFSKKKGESIIFPYAEAIIRSQTQVHKIHFPAAKKNSAYILIASTRKQCSSLTFLFLLEKRWIGHPFSQANLYSNPVRCTAHANRQQPARMYAGRRLLEPRPSTCCQG